MAKSGKVGRPRKYTPKKIEEIKRKLSAYIDKTDIPIIKEFCYKNKLDRIQIYEYSEFATLLKRAVDKKASQLERKALNQEVNVTMAIFSLKQMGWSDKHSVDHTGEVKTELTDASKEDLIKQIEKLIK